MATKRNSLLDKSVIEGPDEVIINTGKTLKSTGKTASKPGSPKKDVLGNNSIDNSIDSLQNGIEKSSLTEEAGKVPQAMVRITFQIRFHTQYGQTLYITGNHKLLGNGKIEQAIPLQYFNDEFWYGTLELSGDTLSNENIIYNYVLRNNDGSLSYDWGNDKSFNPALLTAKDVFFVDSWNYAGYYENAFYTEPFLNVLLKENHTTLSLPAKETYTHTFKIKSPLLAKGQTVCLLGNTKALSNWDTAAPILLLRKQDENYYETRLDLSGEQFPLAYKYGVYDTEKKEFVRFEDGNNRILFDTVLPNKQTVVNDGFAMFPSTTWKGAGVAIPVFSLRSNNGLGVGEFTDLKLLVDWGKRVGLKLIQILPINDTTATHTWVDSYPYAAISAFALHPIYLNIDKLIPNADKETIEALQKAKDKLNVLSDVDYEAVMNLKLNLIKPLYEAQKEIVFKSADYKAYYELNKHWLVPYAAFCCLRDKFGTADFNQWPELSTYNEADIAAFTNENSPAYNNIALHYFIQYQLHVQLKEATEYAHENGIVVKGDVAIGVYRFGADAWQQPDLYHMDFQAGAPPDDFAVKGQNWGFPTYNWQRMKEDGFAWWQQRFEQMSYYFDAFRIDHILGFFRIWSIPMDAVEGIMGHFVPAIPVNINELRDKGIDIDINRLTKPYINDAVLWEVFGHDNEHVKNEFVTYDGYGTFTLKPEFNTQRKVEKYFSKQEENDFNNKIKSGLYDLISNVILFEAEGNNKQQFHFRFAISSTTSFRQLDAGTQYKLDELYINYFFRRQDDFWMKEAMQKLPGLKRKTNMLVCGEDLGLVPACVPDVMKQLGLLSLEIQRMPKNPATQFFNPKDAPYLSVVTPSTHDMSTIRGWWEEDRQRTQQFYNDQLQQHGEAPFYCEPWINKAIVQQHLYSPAMWSIFQLQDLMGIDAQLRRANPNDERINVPANPKNYWRYRMHLTLENLQQETNFNGELKKCIKESGR